VWDKLKGERQSAKIKWQPEEPTQFVIFTLYLSPHLSPYEFDEPIEKKTH
jgi:hypothetical protein